MTEDITGDYGETIGEVVDYHDDSGNYLGTGFARTEEKGCLELLVLLPFLGMLLLACVRGLG